MNPDSVRAFSGRTGNVLYTARTTLPDLQYELLASLGDVDGDGAGDFVEVNWPKPTPWRTVSFIVRSGRDGSVIRSHSKEVALATGFGNEPRFLEPIDINRDGIKDYSLQVQWSYPNEKRFRREVIAFSGADSSQLSGYTIGSESSDGGQVMAHGEDLNGDGDLDTIVSQFWRTPDPINGGNTIQSTIYAIQGLLQEGHLDFDSLDPSQVLWTINADDYLPRQPATFIGDVTNDGVVDLVVRHHSGTANGTPLAILSGMDGGHVWDSATGAARMEGIVSIGDVDRDGYPDFVGGHGVIYSAQSIHLLSGQDGSVLDVLTSTVSDDRFGEFVEAIGDLDGDGISEVAVSAIGIYPEARGRIDVVSFRQPREPTVAELTGFRLLKQGGAHVLTWNDGLSESALENSTDLIRWEPVNDVVIDGLYIIPTTVTESTYYRLRFQR